MMKNAWMLKPFWSIAWLVPTLFMGKLAMASYLHSSHFIRTVHLLDSGSEVRFEYLIGRPKVINIESLKKPDIENYAESFGVYGLMAADLWPVMVNDNAFMFDSKGKIYDDLLFKAVMQGISIDLAKDKGDGNDQDVIDVWVNYKYIFKDVSYFLYSIVFMSSIISTA